METLYSSQLLDIKAINSFSSSVGAAGIGEWGSVVPALGSTFDYSNMCACCWALCSSR